VDDLFADRLRRLAQWLEAGMWFWEWASFRQTMTNLALLSGLRID